jgi:signal transduction histidine kinase
MLDAAAPQPRLAGASGSFRCIRAPKPRVYPHSLPFALALLATALFTSNLALYSFGRRAESAPVRTFAGVLTAVTWFCGAAALELMATTLEGKVLAEQFKFAGLAALGPLWAAFALRYTRREHLLTPRNGLLMALPGILGTALALTNDLHHLVWTGFSLDPTTPALIITGYGSAFWLFLLAQYGLIGYAAVAYAQAYAQTAYLYRQQIGLMLAGALVPLAGNAITLLGLYPVRGLDLTPYSFALSAVFLAVGLFRFGLLAVQPVAARVVFNHLNDPVVVLDLDDRVIDLNPSARRLLGLGDGAIGRPAPPVIRQAQAAFDAVQGNGAERPAVPIGGAEPRRWYRVEISPLRDADGRPLGRVALFVDVTHERELAQLRSDLTHMLIHDLSNPLSAMQMALELVEPTEVGPNQPLVVGREAREAVAIIRRSNERAQRLVSGLLDVSRLESGSMDVEPEAVNAYILMEEVRRELLPWAEENKLALRLEPAPNLPDVRADYELLDRVLRNLVGNAIKYTPAGGTVTLRAEAEPPYVRFTVQDDGPGLPPEVQQRLFQKFVRGTGKGHGHGLGLAFCKLAVEAMGGRIWAESQLGAGTAFHFTLPAESYAEPDEA